MATIATVASLFSAETAILHAAAFLIAPLSSKCTTTTRTCIHLTLEVHLKASFENNWFPENPQKGSGARCLTLSPSEIPPQPILAACHAARVRWADWIQVLGGQELDLFIDPGKVSVRRGAWGTEGADLVEILWCAQDELATSPPSVAAVPKYSPPQMRKAAVPSPAPKVAIVDDQHEKMFNSFLDGVFAADDAYAAQVKLAAPSFFDAFASAPPLSLRTSALVYSDSEEDTSSSDGDSSASPASGRSSPASATSSLPATTTKQVKYISRRERARLAHVVVDVTKTKIVPYDGGKTTVLAGGVMLGSKKAVTPTKAASSPITPVKTPALSPIRQVPTASPIAAPTGAFKAFPKKSACPW